MTKKEEQEFRERLLAPLDRLRAQNLNEADTTIDSGAGSSDVSNPAHMSINQYVSNPTGKGSGYVAKRAVIKQRIELNLY